MKKSQYIAAGTLAVAILAGGAVASTASAANTTAHQALVQKIAEKFNLNQSDVQQVFDDHRNEMRAEKEARLTERLDQAVNDDDITSAQKDQIIAKLKDMQAKMDAIRDDTTLSNIEKRTQAEQLRTELENWAKDNAIDTQWIRPLGKRGGLGDGHGMRGEKFL